MRISVKIDGLEYLNADVIDLMRRMGIQGFGFIIQDGATVDIEAGIKGEGALHERYTYKEPKDEYCCCHECVQDRDY